MKCENCGGDYADCECIVPMTLREVETIEREHVTIQPYVEITFSRPEGYENADCPDCGDQLSHERAWMTADNGLDWLWFGWTCHDCCMNYELDLTPIPND